MYCISGRTVTYLLAVTHTQYIVGLNMTKKRNKTPKRG